MSGGRLTAVSAWFWAFQFALLNPVLAVLLTTVYGASGRQVGFILALYNAASFAASLIVPVVADRRGSYVSGMVLCALCGAGFVAVLGVTSSLPIAALSLVSLGAPTGVGSTLLFAQLRHGGAQNDAVVRMRAVVSFAWVIGPPVSTLVSAAAPGKAVLVLVGAIALVNVSTSVVVFRRASAVRGSAASVPRARESPGGLARALGAPTTWGVIVVFVGLQMLNSAIVTTMGLFVTRQLHAPIAWAGAALGVSALAEIPALLVIGRLLHKTPPRVLIAAGAGIGCLYYTTVAVTQNPWVLVLVQPLNAWFFATTAAVGLTVFQNLVPSPALAVGVFANTQRVASILAGGLISVVATAPVGFHTLYWICAGASFCVSLVVFLRRIWSTLGLKWFARRGENVRPG